MLWWASWRRSKLLQCKKKLRGGRRATSLRRWGTDRHGRGSALAMTPQKNLPCHSEPVRTPVWESVPLAGADAPVRPAPAAQHYVGQGPRAPPHARFPGGTMWASSPTKLMTRNVAHNTADAKCIPAASGQRGRVSGQRMAPRRPNESKGANFAHPGPRGKGDRRGRHPSREKDSKTLVLAAFFPPFLCRRKKGSRRRHKNRSAGERIATAAERLAMTGFFS